MSFTRIEVRAEDVLAFVAAAGLAMIAGGGAFISKLTLSEDQMWELSFILAPAAVLTFVASVRYSFGRKADGTRGGAGEVFRVLRDWLPFLLFLLIYSAFRQTLWSSVLGPDKDSLLLEIDRTLFPETPAVLLQRFLDPVLTDVLAVCYFLHLILPPILAGLLYRTNKTIFRRFLLSVLVCGVLGAAGYALVPAVGPGVAFPQLFRDRLEGTLHDPLIGMMDAARAPRDVFPSLHVAISAIVLWYAGKHRRLLFWTFFPLVLGNWVATLYLRYHYFIDLVAGYLTALLAVVIASWLLETEKRLGLGPRTAERSEFASSGSGIGLG
ncbi:MAG: hypothetical protein DIJKHBIC_01348 [Thermoanaerobaculia bacterium]|nr:hypothetical protein [Thermoanaerobaculia bacterium]